MFPQGEEQSTTIRTLSGAVIMVETEDVQSSTRRPLSIEEYETCRKLADDTLEGQWELANWCLRRGLTQQREKHLQRVIELDSEHLGARRGLGHQKYDDQWMSRDEYMQSQGQVKYRGKYLYPQELAQIQAERAAKEEERQWYKKVNRWAGWVAGRDPERQREGLQQLSAIVDPHALPALERKFREHKNQAARVLYVQILSELRDDAGFESLLFQILYDPAAVVRRAALSRIKPELRTRAIETFVQELKNEFNPVIGRAADALAEIGDEQVIPALINALVTDHRYRVTVEDNSGTYSFGSDGTNAGFASGASLPPGVEMMLRTGQLPYGVKVVEAFPGVGLKRTKQVTVTRTHQNASVRKTLNKLSGEDFAYDEAAWRLWWNRKKNTVDDS